MDITLDRLIIEQALDELRRGRVACEWAGNQSDVDKIAKAMDALHTALAESSTCTWYQDGDYDSSVYGTSCQNYFDITDGTPEDNKMQWCCYCGKKLVQELITEDEDE